MSVEASIWYQPVYYLNGKVPKNKRGQWGQYYVSDPPTAGHSHAFVLKLKEASKRLILFCPFSMTSYAIASDAGEIANFEPLPLDEDNRLERLVSLLKRRWDECCKSGFQRDYDIAALVFTQLGIDVPTTSPKLRLVTGTDGEEIQVVSKRSSGKEPQSKLIKPVVKASKRGAVAKFFAEGPRSIMEAMAVLEMSRSGILTHLHGLHKYHGLGYSLSGDTAEIELPAKVTDMFGGPTGQKLGKPLDPEKANPLPAKGKRLQVCQAFEGVWASIEEVASLIGATPSSVRSHLYDLHTKHGAGYELSDDKAQAFLTLPEGLDLLA